MNFKKKSFWGTVANLILRNRRLILAAIVLATLFFATQWQYMRFTFTEANLLPDKHPENVQYNHFIKTFGEEGNMIVIALKNSDFFEQELFEKWVDLNQKIESFPEVDFILSTNNIQEPVKDESQKRFVLQPVLDYKSSNPSSI
jgi:predicted RND superfamily exporter protein